jgi:hypothetical protein
MAKMSPAQTKLYAELKADGEVDCWVECRPSEWRTAQALQVRGLVKILGERSEAGFFDVELLGPGMRD